MNTMKNSEVFNYKKINDFISTSGQPSKEDFRKIKEDGFELIIDLAPIDYERYSIQDQPEVLRVLELPYIHIPVDFKSPAIEDYEYFSNTLKKNYGKKIWIHCAANYRVTVFFSIWAEKNLDWTEDHSKKLIDSIWKSDPNWTMNDIWRDFMAYARSMEPA
ncbi:protein tyrosine phosphatase family protein [Thalassolituus sp.]|jgi:protein tyrosine phosphatase (PTP) superfamily phosphohydrolase (DUF442 family)|uniref:protein tyrosine phosphatase family protein n=1 Tax=Thalassolituus sp. TaxID=2030822 RepID=UPI002A83BB8B|nr:protein tyrosine phosphatase family protein [Thalassolituus sp.]|tara:strand:+ start:6439 stop:6921 length:483 start_codon:yes stop_codon:yes gene_type:complete